MRTLQANRPLPPLPQAAQAYLDVLPRDVIMTALAGLDRTGVAVWDVSTNLSKSPPLCGLAPTGCGYGVTDADAITGGLGECCEAAWPSMTAITRRRDGKSYTRGSYRDLVASVGERAVVNPLTLCLPAGSPVGTQTELLWDEAKRLATGETVLVPLDVAASDDADLPEGYHPFTPLITNGLGAGPTRDWAVAHGLGELLQRNGNGLLFRALDRGVTLDLGHAASPEVRALAERLAGVGITVLPKFATDEFGLANVFVVGHDVAGHHPRVPIMLSACGEACDVDANRALHKAMLEFASARVRKAFAHGPLDLVANIAPPGYLDIVRARPLADLIGQDRRAFDAMKAWFEMGEDRLRTVLSERVHANRGSKPLADLPMLPRATVEARQARLFDAMAVHGVDILYIDSSPPGHPVHVVKVIAPTLEVETMSYARIGERNTRKLIEADSPMICFGEPTPTRRPVRLTDAALARLGYRQPLFDVAEADRIVGQLYPLYREPDAHAVALALEAR